MEIIDAGTTSFVECLVDGKVVKTPMPSHHHDTAAELATEAAVYARIGPPPAPGPRRLVDHALVMEYMPHGQLKYYLAANPSASAAQRLRWAR